MPFTTAHRLESSAEPVICDYDRRPSIDSSTNLQARSRVFARQSTGSLKRFVLGHERDAKSSPEDLHDRVASNGETLPNAAFRYGRGAPKKETEDRLNRECE